MRKLLLASHVISVSCFGCNTFDSAPSHELRTPETPPIVTVPGTPPTATVPLPQALCGVRQDYDEDGFTVVDVSFCPAGSALLQATPETDDCNDRDDTRHVAVAWGTDADGDGYGAGASLWLCEGETRVGLADNFSDCDDTDPSAQLLQYRDRDEDGAGALARCGECVGADAPGYAPNMDDCDDSNAHLSPTLAEVSYDGVDNNCDGYDVVLDAVTTGDPPAFTDSAWCSGAALAVVAVHSYGPFTMGLEIGNVGTMAVTNGMVTVSSDASGAVVEATALPMLVPGETYLSHQFGSGTYHVALTYDGRGAGRAVVTSSESSVTGESFSDVASSQTTEVGTSTGGVVSSAAATGGQQDIAPPIDTHEVTSAQGSSTSDSTGVQPALDASAPEALDAGAVETGDAGAVDPPFDGQRCDRILDTFTFVVKQEVAAL